MSDFTRIPGSETYELPPRIIYAPVPRSTSTELQIRQLVSPEARTPDTELFNFLDPSPQATPIETRQVDKETDFQFDCFLEEFSARLLGYKKKKNQAKIEEDFSKYLESINKQTRPFTDFQEKKIQEIYTHTRQYFPLLHIRIIENFYGFAFDQLSEQLAQGDASHMTEFFLCKKRMPLPRVETSFCKREYSFYEVFYFLRTLIKLEESCTENQIKNTVPFSEEFSKACILLTNSINRFPSNPREKWKRDKGYYIRQVKDLLESEGFFEKYERIRSEYMRVFDRAPLIKTTP